MYEPCYSLVTSFELDGLHGIKKAVDPTFESRMCYDYSDIVMTLTYVPESLAKRACQCVKVEVTVLSNNLGF